MSEPAKTGACPQAAPSVGESDRVIHGSMTWREDWEWSAAEDRYLIDAIGTTLCRKVFGLAYGIRSRDVSLLKTPAARDRVTCPRCLEAMQ